MTNRAKFLVFKGEDGKWYFSLYANNNEIVCQSEGYESKRGAMDGIQAVKDAAKIAKTLVEID